MKFGANVDDFVARNPSLVTSSANDYDGKSEGTGSKNGRLRLGTLSTNNGLTVVDKHIDVHEEEGWITIPCKELPDGWSEESDMLAYRSLDRSFVFPGEQVHILACLSTCKNDRETRTSVNVAEVKGKNVIGQNTRNQSGETEHGSTHVPEAESSKSGQNIHQNTNDLPGQKIIHANNEEYRRRSQELLKRFRNSHFFARIAETDEALWSRRTTEETFRGSTSTVGVKFLPMESNSYINNTPPLNERVDRGNLDASTSGGVAKNEVKCSLLANGDIVVLLQVNIGVDYLREPVLEILQFEKHQSMTLTSGCLENSDHTKLDPYGDLLKWLLPVQNSISEPRLLSQLETTPISSGRSSLTKPNTPSSFGSQNFLLGHLRSHSMSSISSMASKSVTPTLSVSNSRPSVGLDDWDHLSSSNVKSVEGLLSFRGVPLEPERFSVHCGLEGIYIPGRRWRKKIEIIQPLEIHCFDIDCNTEDYLCVQIKNVSPAHAPDIVIYLDAITVLFEESSKSGPHLSLPITCVEAGNDQVLPGLALRKGEEHSFILKPQTSLYSCNALGERSSRLSQLQAGSAQSSVYNFSNVDNGASPANRYAVLVSCRSNYTESRLFFKQPTNWRPRIQKDLLISVRSQMSTQTLGPDVSIPHLPVQVLTLQASNLTNEDLKLTLLAPASLGSSMVSLDCSPASPVNPFDGGDMQGIALQRLCSASKVLDRRSGDSEQTITISNVLGRNDLGRTHLWLKSRVPLGCVPSRSTIIIKLELLPLSDGIITLDSLQISVEKGLSYVPEHPLKINAASGISLGVI